MFKNSAFNQSVKNLFQENLLFSMSVIFFSIFLSLSIFIQSHPSDSFKSNHEMHTTVSNNIYLPVFDKNEIASYHQNIKDYNIYQQKLLSYNQQKLKNPKFKGQLPSIVPEPITPSLLLVSLKDFYTKNYALSNYQGVVESLDHSISCRFTYDSSNNMGESNCSFIDNGHIKSQFLSKYKVLSQERSDLLEKMKLNDIDKLPSEQLSFVAPNDYVVRIHKILILGNLYLSVIAGLLLSFIILFAVAWYKSRQSSITL